MAAKLILTAYRFIISLVVAVGLGLTAFSQDYTFERQRREMLVFNVAFNGLVGGMGRLINKEKETKALQAFSKGFAHGALGGSLQHIGMSLTHQIAKKKQLLWAWPSRIVNAAGSSIVLNTARNNKMLDELHFNLYLFRLAYKPYDKKFSVRLFTSSLFGLFTIGKGATLNWRNTINSGIFIFGGQNSFSSTAGGSSRGAAVVNSIGIGDGVSNNEFYPLFAHEVAHILQYDQIVGGNALLYQPDLAWKESSKAYKALSKFVYFDLNGPIFFVAYRLEGRKHSCNFFEQEAVNYGETRLYTCRH